MKLQRNRTLTQKEGYVVIKPDDELEVTPIACPLCLTLMKSLDDASHYNKFKCCQRCADDFAYPNKIAWDDGWRPSTEQLNVALEKRPKTRFSI